MEIAIISDTHLPRGRRRLPADCVARLRSAELIVHAGDFASVEALRELQSFGEVIAVHGDKAWVRNVATGVDSLTPLSRCRRLPAPALAAAAE